MGLFRKKDKVIDLAERYKSQHMTKPIPRPQPVASKSPMSLVREGAFSIFGDANPTSTVTSTGSTASDNLEFGSDAEERRKKLAKRLVDMTSRIEDISNQIYHLQQRLDVIERKMNINRFE